MLDSSYFFSLQESMTPEKRLWIRVVENMVCTIRQSKDRILALEERLYKLYQMEQNPSVKKKIAQAENRIRLYEKCLRETEYEITHDYFKNIVCEFADVDHDFIMSKLYLDKKRNSRGHYTR